MSLATSFAGRIRRSENVSLANSIGRRISTTITAELDLPRFDSAAMDGYALSGGRNVYPLRGGNGIRPGEVPAELSMGQAARISTGSRMPKGADRVVLQEYAVRSDEFVSLTKGEVEVGANIRLRGEDVRRGDTLLTEGETLDERKMALLAAQGFASIGVLCAPRVAVISSGSELRRPGDRLGPANVFDCNGPMLMALAARAGADVTDGGCYPDDLDTLSQAVSTLSENHDLIVLSGGASCGEPDLTALALRKAGAVVEELKIAMKPGKPALVGSVGETAVLGLPGNPVAAYVSWFTLGRSMIAAMCGSREDILKGCDLEAINELQRKPGCSQFVPARRISRVQGEALEFLGRGGSASLLPLSRADGFAYIEAGRGNVLPTERVNFVPFEPRQTGFAQVWGKRRVSPG
jgi:molybdopterin molybdotransferase